MAAPNLLGLPPISSDLKPILPYLQRADELRQKEPVMSYWCAYYAAQVGISLKAKDTASRTLLFELLGTLERMKSAIGANDAIDLEAVSSAYVENFALRVFGTADNEDRKGQATRATAKKFLAAANFLEVLKVFPKTEIAESTDEKIRYAKWKAADISKAFREGRKPDAGPPGSTEETSTPPVVSLDSVTTGSVSSGSPKNLSPTGSGNRSPPHIKRSFPSDSSPHTPHKPAHLDPSSLIPRWGPGDVTPGSWSTAATPGTASPRNLSATSESFSHDPESPSTGKGKKQRSGSGSSSGSGSTASVGRGSPNGKKSVHFTPSVVGGLSSTSGSPPPSPSIEPHRHDIYAQPAEYHDNFLPQPSAPPLPPQLTNIYAPPPSGYSPNNIYTPPAPAFSTPPIVTEAAPIELTPAIIAKAQKHCRFAISSLDYEDAEQARKELRAALKVLGG